MHELCRSLDGLPLAIELAAARTKTLSIEEITRRLDDRFNVLSDPTSRRPERRRALKSTIRWSYDLLFPDDQRGLWAAGHLRGGAPLPAVESVLEALDVPAAAAIDVVGRLASRSLVIVDDEEAPMTVRYRLLDSIRAFALEAMTDAGLSERALRRARRMVRRRRRILHAKVRSSRQAEHLAFARAERANIDAALAWSIVHDPPLALGIVNGFGWAWVVLGDSRGAQRILAALDAAGDDAGPGPRPGQRPAARRVDRSVDRSPRPRPRPHRRRHRPGRHDQRCRPAGALLLLPRLRRVAPRRLRQAMELTDRSDALYEGLDRPWDQAANWLFAARPRSQPATRSAASTLSIRSSTGCERSTTRGCTSAATRCSASWPASSTASTMPSSTSVAPRKRRDVSASCRPRPTTSPASDERSARPATTTPGAATLGLAIDKAEATGDVRLAALARVHLGRVLRALGQVAEARTALEAAAAWHRAAGGGEQAALGECLLAAMDAADREPGAEERLVAILDEARATTTPTSRSSPSTHWPASPPKLVTSPRPATSVRRPIGAWKPPPTSSPTSTEPTPTRSGRSPER